MYRPNNVPPDAASIPAFLNQELPQIARALEEPVFYLDIAISNSAPRVPTDGRTVRLAIADGTNWNPGSGAGLYRYQGGSWVFIG